MVNGELRQWAIRRAVSMLHDKVVKVIGYVKRDLTLPDTGGRGSLWYFVALKKK